MCAEGAGGGGAVQDAELKEGLSVPCQKVGTEARESKEVSRLPFLLLSDLPVPPTGQPNW